MADLLASYLGLSASSPRTDVSKALNAIISCAWPIHDPSPALTFPDLCAALSIDNTNRAALATSILLDIKSCEAGGASGRLQHTGTLSHSCFLIVNKSLFSDVHLALSAIKALGRHPSGSAVVASDNNLSVLLAASKSFKDSNLEASLDALRCIANALLLIESARATLLNGSVNGGEYAVLLLEVG
jgi:hypothetical protein